MSKPRFATQEQIDHWEKIRNKKNDENAAITHNEKLDTLDNIENIEQYEPVIQDVINRLGGRVLRRSSVAFERADIILTKVLKNQHIKTAVEIGPYNGLCSLVMSEYVAKVVAIDIEKAPLWADVTKDRNIDLYLIKSEEYKKYILDGLDFQFAYVDGDHAATTLTDWEAVKKCGYVLFGECKPTQKPVWDLVHSLPKNEVTYHHKDFALWQKN